jgi:phospholipid/cholesterol/gamma-HCH transport system ATP-binding protein
MTAGRNAPATDDAARVARPHADGEAVMRLVDVRKSFGEQVVLDGLSFEVRRGRTLAIMGPSGTGKSVVLRHLIGLLKADSGLVEVEGHDMGAIGGRQLAELRRRMGFLFQEGALINWLTAGENVALPLRENTRMPDAEIRTRVQEKLELVHVPESLDKLPSQLSGGMKKRVALARALITDPEIVLYDEPNAGLDPEISASINETIRELSQRLHTTSIVVEHRVACVRTVADEVLFLDGGKALVHLPTAEFFRAEHPRLARFLGDLHERALP